MSRLPISATANDVVPRMAACGAAAQVPRFDDLAVHLEKRGVRGTDRASLDVGSISSERPKRAFPIDALTSSFADEPSMRTRAMGQERRSHVPPGRRVGRTLREHEAPLGATPFLHSREFEAVAKVKQLPVP